MTRKLNSMPYAQATVNYDDDENFMLVSYRTPVVIVRNNWLFCTGLYSRTTIRHISAFGKEIGIDYYTIKKLYQMNLAMNLETGEVRDLP